MIFWIGSILGLCAGIGHAVYILSSPSGPAGGAASPMAWYRAVWACVLWTVFGAYLSVLWLVGAGLRLVLGVRDAPVETD